MARLMGQIEAGGGGYNTPADVGRIETRDHRHVSRKRYALALVAIGLLAAVTLAAPAWTIGPSRYVGWATAVEAFGTVMAFAAAAAAFIWQWNESKRRDEEAQREAKAAQARLVSCWLVVTDEAADESGELGGLRITVRNGSAAPITKVVATVVDGRGGGPELFVIDGLMALFDVIPPSFSGRQVVPNPGGAMGWRPAVQIGFSDSAGRHWIRHSNGPLYERDEPLWVDLGIEFGWSWTGILADGAVDSA